MIEVQKCFVIDGKAYRTLEEAQAGALETLFLTSKADGDTAIEDVVQILMEHKDDVIAILGMKTIGRPRKPAGKRTVKPKAGNPPSQADIAKIPISTHA